MKIAIKKAGYTQVSLAETLGVDVNTVWRWTKGTSPTDDRKREIAAILGVSVAYLMGETDNPGPQLVKGSEGTRTKKIEEKSNVRMGGKFLEIPLLTMATAASCGAGNGLYGVIPESTENIFVEVSTFKCLDETRKPFAIPIEGDSMTGAGLEEGANAVINPAEEVMNGDAALISCDGDWLIKWVVYNPDGSVDLRPANPNYSPRHIESAYASDPSWFSIIGKVVAVVRKSVPKRAF